jgi:hypothetical protein
MVLLEACGARASLEASEDGEPTGAGSPRPGEVPPPSPTDGAGGSRAAADRPPDNPLAFTTSVLPDCEPGFTPRRAAGRTCTYRAEGLCYEEVLAACACVCPREQGTTQCVVGDFLSATDEPQRVSCTVR